MVALTIYDKEEQFVAPIIICPARWGLIRGMWFNNSFSWPSDCSIEKKIKKNMLSHCHVLALRSRWYIIRQNTKFVLRLLHVHAPDSNMDSCRQPKQPPFFLLYSAEQILLLTPVVALRSSLPGIARYRLPGDFMKTSLSLFSIFRLPKTRHLLRNQCSCR